MMGFQRRWMKQPEVRFGVVIGILVLTTCLGFAIQESAQAQPSRRRLSRILGTLRDGDASREEKAEAWDLLRDLSDELHHEQFDRRRAKVLYDAAFVLARSAPEATAEERLGWFERAARAAASSVDRRDLALVQYERATLLHEIGRNSEARNVLEEALATTRGVESYRFYLQVLLADVLTTLGELARAQRLLESVDEDSLPLGGLEDPLRRHRVAIDVKLLLKLGLADRAAPLLMDQLEEVARLSREDSNRDRALLTAKANEVQYLLQIEDFEGVRDRVSRILAEEDELFRDHPRMRLQLAVNEALARAELERVLDSRGTRDEASPSRAATLLEQLLDRDDLASESRFEALRALVEIEIRGAHFDRATSSLQRARALVPTGKRGNVGIRMRSILQTLEARLAMEREEGRGVLEERRAGLLESFSDLLEQWKGLFPREGGVGFLAFGHRRAVLSELIRLTIRLDPGERGRGQALSYLIRTQSLGTLTRGSLESALDLETLRRELVDEDRGLLVYFPAPARSHVFSIDGKTLNYEELPPRDRLEEIRESHLVVLAVSPRRVGDADAKTSTIEREGALAQVLKGLLFPDSILRDVEGWKGVTIVGSDLLGPVAFEWLPWGQESRMGVELAVDYLPSIPLGIALCRRRAIRGALPPPELDFALVGSVDREDLGLPELRLSELQRGRLFEGYSEDRIEFFAGDRASIESLEQFDFSGVSTLQFLVHGIRDGRGLAIALAPGRQDDGRLFREDVEDRFGRGSFFEGRAPSLVLLTACGSGLGPVRRGDPGAADFGGAFLAAGAQAVVLSQSDLDFSSTVDTSVEFHGYLAQGFPPAESLRRVREKAYRLNPELAPFEGGLLQVVGLGQFPLPGGVRVQTLGSSGGVKRPTEPHLEPEGAAGFGGGVALGILLGVLLMVTTGFIRRLVGRDRRKPGSSAVG